MKRIFNIAMIMILTLSVNAQNFGLQTFSNTKDSPLGLIWSEDFESGSIPDDWVEINSSGSDGWVVGENLSPGAWCQIPAHTKYAGLKDFLYGELNNEWLITDAISLVGTINPTFIMDYMNCPLDADGVFYGTLTVKISKDDGATWPDTLFFTAEKDTEWQTQTCNLNAYIGETIKLAFCFDDQGRYADGIFIDDLKVLDVLENDLAVAEVTPDSVMGGVYYKPSVKISNLGTNAQTSFSVSLSNSFDYDETITFAGDLAFAADTVITFPSYMALGENNFTAKITLADDQDTENNVFVKRLKNIDANYTHEAYAGDFASGEYGYIDLTNGNFTRITGSYAIDWLNTVAEEYNGTCIYRLHKNNTLKLVYPNGKTSESITISGVPAEAKPYGLSWNWDMQAMFMLVKYNDATAGFGSLNLETYAYNELVHYNGVKEITAMEFCGSDELYAVSTFDLLYKANNTSIETVGSIGTDISYNQDLSYNITDNKLYTVQNGASNYCALGTYDLTTGAFNKISDLEGQRRISSFVITNTFPKHNVTFEVSCNSDPAENVTILIDNKKIVTDVNGQASINLPEGDYSYLVFKEYCDTTSYNLNVANSDQTVTHEIECLPTYPVTIVTEHNDDTLANVAIKIAGKTFTTDSTGKIVTYLPNGSYPYSGKKEYCTTLLDTILVENQDVSDTLKFDCDFPSNITFVATDQNGDGVENVTIEIEDEKYTTDADGNLEVLLFDGDYNYKAYKEKCDTLTGAINVAGADFQETLEFTCIYPHEVKFTVTGFGDPIAEASIQIDNTTLETNENGIAQITLYPGDYQYITKAEGFNNDTNSVTITTKDTNINVVLTETIVAPQGLIADVNCQNVTISWDRKYVIEESFENQFPPKKWSVVNTNSGFNWEQSTYHNGVSANHGAKFALVAWSFNNQDEWLITPEFKVQSDYKVKFASNYSPSGTNNNDHYYVKISTDGGNNWTELWDAATSSTIPNEYEQVELSLDEYKGQNVKLAWQAVSLNGNGLAANWYLDNVTVGNVIEEDKNDRALQGYIIYLDDMENKVAETTDTKHLFEDLTPGTHTAGVRAKYITDTTEMVTVEFEVLNNHIVTFNVTENNDPVEKAKITIEGDDTTATLNTDAEGKAQINLLAGDYNYTVIKANCDTVINSLTVADQNITEDIELSCHINNVEIGQSALIAPNPTNGLFRVELQGTYNLKVFDLSGKNVYETEMTDFENIDISNQKAGVYFLSLQGEKETYTYKIIKQ